MYNPGMNMRKLFIFLIFFLVGCQTTRRVDYIRHPDKTQVAIMMPLSGKLGNYGDRLSKLIELGIRDSGNSNIEVRVYDSTTPNDSMEEIIRNNTKVILGPLFANVAQQILNQAKARDIFIISLSNNHSIANEHLFVFGHSISPQTERLFSYLKNREYKDVILLLPNYQKQQNKITTLQNLVKKHKLNLQATQLYGIKSNESIKLAIDKVNYLVDTINDDPNNSEKPIIYVSDEPQNLAKLYDLLNTYQLDQKAVICGDNRINIDYKDPVYFIFTGSFNLENSKLKYTVHEVLGDSHLNLFDKLSYDLGLITAYVIGDKFDRYEFLDKLHDKQGYVGVSGLVRFNNRNIAERKYDILMREGINLYRKIDQAAQEFK